MRSFVLLIIFTLVFSLNAFASSTGWLKIKRKRRIYYKPFVVLNNPNKVIVLFITSNGKIYKGKLLKGNYITPGKHFVTDLKDMLYITLKFNPPSAPKVTGYGRIDALNEKEY